MATVSKKKTLESVKNGRNTGKKHSRYLNKCVDLCYKHSTNHLHHQSLWSAAPLVCSQPVPGCKFPPQILRISLGTLVHGCEETCLVLPGHCVSVHVCGGEAAVWKVKGQQAKSSLKKPAVHVCVSVLLFIHFLCWMCLSTFHSFNTAFNGKNISLFLQTQPLTEPPSSALLPVPLADAAISVICLLDKFSQ